MARREQLRQAKEIISYKEVSEPSTVYNARFKRRVYQATYEVEHRLNTFTTPWDVEDAINNFYEKMMQSFLVNCHEEDVISVEIKAENLDTPIYIPPTRKSDFNKMEFLNSVYVVSQSKTEFLLSGKLSLNVTCVEAVHGMGKRRAPPEAVDAFAKRSRCVVVIHTNENDGVSCGFRAAFVGKYYADHGTSNKQQWQRVRKDYFKVQTDGGKELALKARLDPKQALSVDNFGMLQAICMEYQLIIIDSKSMTMLYKGPPAEKIIALELEDNHYNTIIRVAPYFGASYFCFRCDVPYRDKNRHVCENACTRCHQLPACNDEVIVCSKCNLEFYGSKCLETHLDKNLCGNRVRCKICQVIYRVEKNNKHVCNRWQCNHCSEYYTELPHYCFLATKAIEDIEEEDKVPKIFVMYDIESMQVKSQAGATHVPNLLVSMTVCEQCYNPGSNEKTCETCTVCGKQWNVFKGKECISKFCSLIYTTTAKNAHKLGGLVYVFAHNAKGYDGHFIIKDLFARHFRESPKVIMNGTKILKIDIGNVRFLDSLSFLLLPLASLPKVFGLQDEKGHFPHNFNIPANQSYVGPVPAIEAYGVQAAHPQQAQEIQNWYATLPKAYSFNLQDELLKYCKMDVKILCQSVLIFRNLFKNITGIDPFTRNFTLASIGLETFRTKILSPLTIGITPIGPYRDSKNNSKSGSAYFDTFCKFNNKTLKREQKIGPYWVDGLDQMTVYEYLGCKWHGCAMCFQNRNEESFNGKTYQHLYDATLKKLLYLSEQGYAVVCVWECQARTVLKQNPEMQKYYWTRVRYYKKMEKIGRLKIREAFYGGRTNNIFFYYEAPPGETIEYYDFTSLYPTVLWESEFFLGHPKVITEDFGDVRKYFGFIKAKVLPPQGLHIPVLPVRHDNKLMFPLCNQCMLEKSLNCTHKVEERALTGTWTTMEFVEALKYGYFILEVYEVNHYEQKTDSLFKDYIKMWLKIKQESSGWPSWVKTESDQQQYILSYEQVQGVKLDAEKIKKNPGLRWIAKLMLNSFWGKFAQRPNLTKTALCYDYMSYWDIISNKDLQVVGEVEVAMDTILLSYKTRNEEECSPGLTNIGIAAFVTAYARLRLFREMAKIEADRDGRVLYFDTDSIIFTCRPGEYKPLVGDYLGQMTDEISDEYGVGATISKFVSCGPKNYAYCVKKPDGVEKNTIKAKGIRLTVDALNIVNMQLMIDTAVAYVRGEEIQSLVPQLEFRSDKFHDVITRNYLKVYRAVSDKRKICNNFSRPYGYK